MPTPSDGPSAGYDVCLTTLHLKTVPEEWINKKHFNIKRKKKKKSNYIMAPLSLNQLLLPHFSWRWQIRTWKFKYDICFITLQVSWGNKKAAEHLTISDMRALKCWMASSLLCCSLSRSISLVCSDRAFCTSRSLSLRLASIRACRSNSRSFSMSTLCGGRHTWSASVSFSEFSEPWIRVS